MKIKSHKGSTTTIESLCHGTVFRTDEGDVFLRINDGVLNLDSYIVLPRPKGPNASLNNYGYVEEILDMIQVEHPQT